MKANDTHLLALTTATDEVTGEVKPLFSFPVQVCSAVETEKALWENVTPSGAPTEGLMKVDPITEKHFASSEQRKGVFVGDEFREIPKEAIDEITVASKDKTMVSYGRIDLDTAWKKYGDRITGSYFLQSPQKGGSPKAYRLTYEALRAITKGKKADQRPARAIVTERVSRSRAHPAFIYADEDAKCLRLVHVAYAEKIKDPDALILAPQQAEVNDGMIDKARTMIEQMDGGEQFLDTAEDRILAQRRELVEKALDGEQIAAPPKTVGEAAESDDLMAALEASLAS